MRVKRFLAFACAAACTLSLVSCSNPLKKEDIKLTVWNMEDQDFLQKMGNEFAEKYKKDANIEIIINDKPESSMTEYIAEHPDEAPDIIYFADDQFEQFSNADYLAPIINKDQIVDDNGGMSAGIMKCVYKGGKYYAYPLTAGNGYFLYYNAEYYDEKDVEKLDDILDIAAENGKYFAMDWSSGWYTYSFFGGAGLTAKSNSLCTYNVCDWNSMDGKYKGVDVCEAMLDISKSKGFRNCVNDDFIAGAKDGSVIALVSGQWDAGNLSEAWGENLRAVKLPTFTINGNQEQMAAFIGYKYAGVYSGSKNTEWAGKFAAYISDYDHQVQRFGITGECPSNTQAMTADEVQQSPAVVALAQQAPYSVEQRLADAYWTPSSTLGTILASGNPDKLNLQELLDETVEQITVMPEE